MDFARVISSWFERERENYPWREQPTPYRVWISEVMLQQTQRVRVVEYFSKWMAAMPTVESVAGAQEEELIKLWEGLGYYSRVRNIHKAARRIVEHGFPETVEELIQLPGFGPYTAQAVASFAFGKKGIPFDANVERILGRYYAVKDRKALRSLPLEATPHIAEGIIEFGQKVCGKTPQCHICPLRKGCAGKRDPLAYPEKKKSREPVFIEKEILVLLCKDKVWLYMDTGRLMKGLLQFPHDEQPFIDRCKAALHLEMPDVKHTFTHHRVTLKPKVFLIDEEVLLPYGSWYEKDALVKRSFPSGHRTIARVIYNGFS